MEPILSNGSVRLFRRLGQRLGHGQTHWPVPLHEKRVKGNPAHHLMEGAPLTRWWGIYEQDESEQLKHTASASYRQKED